MNTSENHIDHEVRIRILENIASETKEVLKELKKDLEHKMDTQFHWVLGTIFALIATMLTLFGGIILHLAKLI